MEGKIDPNKWIPAYIAERRHPIDLKVRENTKEKSSAPRVKRPSSGPILTQGAVKANVKLDLKDS